MERNLIHGKNDFAESKNSGTDLKIILLDY